VVLIRKSYAEKRRKRRLKGKSAARAWTLKRMDVEAEESNKKVDSEKMEAERERFMEELEEDPEMRSKIQIYRDPRYVQPTNSSIVETDDDDEDDDVPEVPLEELLNALALGSEPKLPQPACPEGDDDDADDDDMSD